MYIYHYARYHQSGKREHATIESAIDDAFEDHCSGEAWAKYIADEKGNVIMDHEALLEEFAKRP